MHFFFICGPPKTFFFLHTGFYPKYVISKGVFTILRQNALDFINQYRKLPLTDNEHFIWVFHTNKGGYLKSKGNMWLFVIVKQCRWLYINFYAFFFLILCFNFVFGSQPRSLRAHESTPKMTRRGYLQRLGLGVIY